MNWNKVKKLTGSLMALTLVSCCVISGTLAKYTSSVEASTSARVASFDVYPGEDKQYSVNLFDTIWDSDGKIETDVWDRSKLVGNAGVIAPGTQGSFTVALKNASEVSVGYEIGFEVKNEKNIPIVFSTDKDEWVDDLEDIVITGAIRGRVASTATTILPKTETVYWKWDFEGDDEVDTALGLAGTAQIFVDSTLTFTQID